MNLRFGLLPLILASVSSGAPALLNAGFEDTNVLASWRTWIYKSGQDPMVVADATEAKTGDRSLRIEAATPADVALGQVIDLPPGALWRVRAWVKTANLVAQDRTDTGGAVHVQTPEGATLARGPSAFGSTAWHEVAVPFRVPPDGRAKVVLFYVGYGKGTGTVWFDDLRLEAVRAAGRETIRITPERLSRQPVDAKQGGQFIEPLCNLIPSMLAQQVANTSFEVDPPWNVAFRRETDRPHRPWYPDGAVHLARYAFDTNRPFNGQRSLRIELPAPHARAGISQDGFHLQAGRAYHLRLHVRSEGVGSVRATLHGGGGPAAQAVESPIPGPGADPTPRPRSSWTPVTAMLRAERTLENATLTLDFAGPGTLWLDRVSLIPDDAVLGLWRPDVVEALRELRPGVIRFGGSMLEAYEWDRSLGAWDNRAPFPVSYWGGMEENFVGVEEFVALCRAVGAEPLVCVRWTGKQPADAAAEVEYFNGGTETPGGRRRAQNGHPAPWAVKYWQIGNEVGGAAYDASVRAFAEAMRRADPTVRVLSSFPSPDLLRAGGGQIDYLCPHHYGCADLPAMERDFLALERQRQTAAPGRPVRIAVTEWNTTAGDWELKRATLQTLANALACARYHNLLHRHADAVEIAIRSNLIDSFGSGVIQTGPGWLFLAPTYHAQRLYARAAESYPLRIERGTDDPTAAVPWDLNEPDLSALLSADGHRLRVYGVNTTERLLNIRTTLAGLPAVRDGVVEIVRDTEGARTAEVLNTRDEPQRIRPTRKPAGARGTDFTLEFPPFSLALYELEL